MIKTLDVNGAEINGTKTNVLSDFFQGLFDILFEKSKKKSSKYSWENFKDKLLSNNGEEF